MAAAGGRPCAGCSAVCAGSSPSTEGERPSAGTRRPHSPCWPEPSWRAATLAPSHHSPSPTESRAQRRDRVGLWRYQFNISVKTSHGALWDLSDTEMGRLINKVISRFTDKEKKRPLQPLSLSKRQWATLCCPLGEILEVILAQDKVWLQHPHHVMAQTVDWSHVPHLKSAEQRRSWKNCSRDAVIPAPLASECIPYIILSAKHNKQTTALSWELGGRTDMESCWLQRGLIKSTASFF